MNENLTIRKFGPINDATIELKKTTLLIGDQGTGKSCIAKIISIIYNIYIDFSSANLKDMPHYLKKYNIGSYLMEDSVIVYESDKFKVDYMDNKISVINKKNDFIIRLYEKVKPIQEEIDYLYNEFKSGKIAEMSTSERDNLRMQIINYQNTMKKHVEELIKVPVYIPSERIFLSSISNSLLGLINIKISLPQCVLDFGALFERIRNENRNHTFEFLKISYSHKESKDFISIQDKTFMLSEVSSGIQSCTPMLVVLNSDLGHDSFFIIEEPELNLFPKNQKSLQYFINASCKNENDALLLTTHSPYIIQSLNIAIKAYITSKMSPVNFSKIEDLIPEKYWINPSEFQAYILSDDGIQSIYDEKTGFINYSILDDFTNLNDPDFERLCELNR